MKKWLPFILLALLLAACTPSADTPASTSQTENSDDTPTNGRSAADLTAIKEYLLTKAETLHSSSLALQTAANDYYQLAEAADFDYAALWQQNAEATAASLLTAKEAWIAASPGYEQIEGIVAGVPTLAEYDVILDAGAAGDGEDAAPYDLTLADGRILQRPGNLFGVLESALWGTVPDYTTTVAADLDGSGAVDFGEGLPDALVLKAAADALVSYVADMQQASQAWQPSESDAFTALVVMIPTMNEYFESWKNSRFVAGDASTQSDFVVISRLADIQDILSSLQVVHTGISPLIVEVDAAQDEQIAAGLSNLKTFVADVYQQELAGKQFTAEEADLLGSEAQDQATALAGQVAQVAAQLNVPIQE